MSECLSDLEEIAKEGYEMVIVGDINFECDLYNDGFVQLYSLLSSYNISHCDDFFTVSSQRAVTSTYMLMMLWVVAPLLIICLYQIQLDNISCPG